MVSSPTAKALVLLPPQLYGTLFTPEADAALRSLARVTCNREERNWSSEELAQRIRGYDVVVTGWGSPQFTSEVLSAADQLRLVAHSAGSIKNLLRLAVLEPAISVTHAASAIAMAVGEMSLLLIMLLLRKPHVCDRELKAGHEWNDIRAQPGGREIVGQRVGVVGAGYTGRYIIKLLRALDVEVWVSDPYLSDARAAELGVRLEPLDELLTRCPIVTLQAPTTQETHHMIGARELGLLQDGAILVNTARSRLIDEDALLAELRSGRIEAALDVFDEEPLPVDSPFRQLDNVVLTPHIAGLSIQARHRQGQTMVDEIERFIGGQPLRYEVTPEMLDIMA